LPVRQWNAVGSPDDGHKDARHMLRYYWLPIHHYLLHLVGLSFTYLQICYLTEFVLEWEIFHTQIFYKIKKPSVFNIAFEHRFVYEIMWKNMVCSNRPQTKIRDMLIACWITKAKTTHLDYVKIIVFHRNNGCTNALFYYFSLSSLVSLSYCNESYQI